MIADDREEDGVSDSLSTGEVTVDEAIANNTFERVGTPASDGVHYIERIAEGTWRIDERGFVNCYLLVGERSALLIDTGMGFGDIRETVRELTDLPLEVVLTHRHCDHTGGAAWFASCDVHWRDLRPIYALTGSRLASKTLLRMWTRMLDKMKAEGGDIPEDMAIGPLAFTAPSRGAHYVAIDDDQRFHLGGRDITVIGVPGHTRGSIVLLDPRNRLMFTGDDANPAIWMHLPGCTSLAGWVPGCQRILELADSYTAYGGHSTGLIAREQIAGLLERGRELIATRKNTLFHHSDVYPSAIEEPNLTYDTAKVH